ncbi:MAG: hypothetical protein JNM25_02735 [Planctomycetes bacterium]|nr:hypothetical protein [Planctomycetota bacterium]
MILRAVSVVVFSVLLSGCAAGPAPAGPAAADVPAPAADAAKVADPVAKAAEARQQKQDERKKQAKELRAKQRELAHATVEQQVEAIERRSRMQAVDAALERSAADLEAARRELEVFLKDVKPRELDDRRLSLDGATYRAEHSKDELGELTAMYEADEFARTTKELVLKRGRRDMEMADRRLALETREFAHFEQFELPKRERELRQKLADAELARKKAEAEAEKARLELELASQKRTERQSDLAEEIRELQEALAKDAP